MAGTTIGEFFLDLVVDAGQGQLTINNLVASMGELEVASVGEIAILFELGQRLASITDHAIKTSLALENITSSTGISAQVLQSWGNAAEYAGIKADEMRSVLAEVSHNLSMGKYMGDYGGLKNLGVLLEKSGLSLQNFNAQHPEKLIEAIRASGYFQSQAPDIQYDLLHGSGLQQILAIMQEKRISDTQLQKYLTQGPIITDQEEKRSDSMYRHLTAIRQISEEIGLIIGNWFGSPIEKSLQLLENGFEHSEKLLKKIDKEGVPASGTSLDNFVRQIPGAEVVGKFGQFFEQTKRDFLDNLIRGHQISEGFSPVSTSPSILSGITESKSVVQNHTNTANINGVGLNKYEIADLIQMAFKGTYDPAINMVNRAGH